MELISKINIGGIDYSIRDKVLEEEVSKINPIINQGTINNAADEEDLTSENNLLKLKDRSTMNGMGYVILRKNKSFDEQVTNENTIYEIRYNFTLSKDITIPKNCILKFNGGIILGNYTIIGNNTSIEAGLVKIINTDVTILGSWNIKESYPEWFGAKGDGIADDTQAIQKTINTFKRINAINTYKITSELVINRKFTTFKFNEITANNCDGISLAGYHLTIIGNKLLCDNTHSGVKMGYASAETSTDSYKYAGEINLAIQYIAAGYGLDLYLQQGGHINGIIVNDTWANGKIYAMRIYRDDPNYNKNDLARFNDNTFNNFNMEASMAGIYVENVTWYSVSFNNCRTNEMGLPNRGAAFTFKNCLIANSEIFETAYSSYKKWIIEDTTTFEVKVSGITNGSGHCIANEAFIKYDMCAKKLAPIFKRTDNKIRTPKIVKNITIDSNQNTDLDYYGLTDFILENDKILTIDYDAPYNYLGFNKLTFLVPNINEPCALRIKTADGNYNSSGIVLPQTFEPTIYDVFLTGNNKGYYRESKFNGEADIIDTTLVSLPITENIKYYVNSEHSNVLFKKVYVKIILDKIIFGNPNAPILEVYKDDDETVLKAISPVHYNIGTEETTRTIIAELPNNDSFAYIILRAYGYSNPSSGKIQIRLRGIINR